MREKEQLERAKRAVREKERALREKEREKDYADQIISEFT